MKSKKLKTTLICISCVALPLLIIPPVAIYISKNKSSNLDNDKNNQIFENKKKLNFNLGIEMQKNLKEYFSSSHYSSEFICSSTKDEIINIFSYYFANLDKKIEMMFLMFLN